MVDFQSRDRRRGSLLGDDEGEDDEEADDEAADHESGATEGADREDAPEEGASPSSATLSSSAPSSGVAVVTVSTGSADDESAGSAVTAALAEAGYEVATEETLEPDREGVRAAVDALAGRGDVSTVVTVGATGLGADDVTIEAVHPLFGTALPGFGELFRRRYEATVGTGVVAVRATAGLVGATPVFCLPGDEDAARLGAAEIVAPEAADVAAAAGDGD